MRLIIAEKPSVAQSIAAVLGASGRKDGYIEGGGCLVSWCFGHLAELAQADAYGEQYRKWRLDALPILPREWQYAVSPDKEKQFNILRDLMNRSDVTEVVNACDAGREGELIFRTVYELAHCAKPMKRLWISSMEDSAIRDGFAHLREGGAYDGLYDAALCRSRADWLVGINATRLFTLLYGKTLNIGRVMSPTLALLVERESEIEAFQSQSFYTVCLTLDGGDTAVSQRYEDRAAAQRIADACRGQQATVGQAEKKERTQKPPALYDLTTLQRDANRILGYTAQQTLDYLQGLYEKKLCTYPRTDSRYLTGDMEASVPDYAADAASVCGLDAPEQVNAGQVCNSAKVSDHHALLPTHRAGDDKTLVEALPEGEREVLRLVAKQVLCAVGNAYRYSETKVVLSCAETEFEMKGKTVLDMGWKRYRGAEKETVPQHLLPDVVEGQSITVSSAAVKEGKTTPPDRYTEDTLLSAMERAGNEDADPDAERRGLGTPATRAAILEKLTSVGFVERRKSQKTTYLIPTQIGTSLITVLPEQLQSPLFTAQWEHQLKQVEHGELDAETFLRNVSAMISGLVQDYELVRGAEVLFPSDREAVGTCPRCGKTVTEGKKGFFCENRADNCRFALWKDSKFFTAKKKALTKNVASALLHDGKVRLTGCFSPKTGKTYNATVILRDDGAKTEFEMIFDKKKKS